jgi:hypothetical protein
MTKIMLALAMLSVCTSYALAGEGNGDPFQYQVPGATHATRGVKLLMLDTAPFTLRMPGQGSSGMTLLTPSGSEAPVQTANSVPAGALSPVPGRGGPGPTLFAGRSGTSR